MSVNYSTSPNSDSQRTESPPRRYRYQPVDWPPEARRTPIYPSVGRASELPAGSRVILWLRVSTKDQQDHLETQERILRDAAKRWGWIVIAVVPHVGTGKFESPNSGKTHRIVRRFRRTVAFALEQQAVIVSATLSRLRRSFLDYQPDNVMLLHDLRVLDLEELMTEARGVKLFTLLDPDASQKEEAAAWSKWGGEGDRLAALRSARNTALSS